MLSMGGQPSTANLSAQDPWTNDLGIFDMSEPTWGFDYTANAAAYTPAPLVSNHYNKSIRYPTFDEAALASIFNSTAAKSTATNATAVSPLGTTTTITGTPGFKAAVPRIRTLVL